MRNTVIGFWKITEHWALSTVSIYAEFIRSLCHEGSNLKRAYCVLFSKITQHLAQILLACWRNWSNINTIQDEGGAGKKAPRTSFSPVTSTNVGFGPQNFLTFSFNPFATLVQNFKFVPSASPKLLNLN